MQSRTNLTREENFRLSRVYAKGWNAARSQSLDPVKTPPNPFATQPERDRWNEGYNGALEYYRSGPRFVAKQVTKAES